MGFWDLVKPRTAQDRTCTSSYGTGILCSRGIDPKDLMVSHLKLTSHWTALLLPNRWSHYGSQRKRSVELTQTHLWKDICCSFVTVGFEIMLCSLYMYNTTLNFYTALSSTWLHFALWASQYDWLCTVGKNHKEWWGAKNYRGSRVGCRNRIFRGWDASQGHSLASGHHHPFLKTSQKMACLVSLSIVKGCFKT